MKWSAGLAAAVMCQDSPQIFDMRLAPALRTADAIGPSPTQAQRFRHLCAVQHRRIRGMPLTTAFIDQCDEWRSSFQPSGSQ